MRGLKRRVGSSDGYGNIIRPIKQEKAERVFGQLFIDDTIYIINKQGSRVNTWRVV